MLERFRDLKCPYTGNLVKSRPVIVSGGEDTKRLYLTGTDFGFTVVAVEYHSCIVNEERPESDWDHSELIVNVAFTVAAFTDGVRHLHVNTTDSDIDVRGYLYYPDAKFMAECWKKIAELEQEYCSELKED